MKDKTRMILAAIGVVVIALLVWGLMVTGGVSDEEQAAIDAEKERASQTGKISLLLKCQNAVQPTLKNPSSMRVEYSASAIGEMSTGQLGAVMKYYAKNSFGGEILNTTNCLFDTDGKLLDFEQVK